MAETAEALVWLLDAYMRRPTQPPPSAAVLGTSYLSDDSVIAKASEAKNGEKFCRLWSGDITGYPSHSEADAALASMLAFWCGGDAGQIDRLFRQSGLMREKWDELRGADTYGNLTIAKALSGMTDSYKPVVSTTVAEDFPKSVKEATERYQHDSDRMVLFFEDNLVADDTAEELTSTVYARYKGWCQENGCYPEGMKNFKQGLQAFAQVVRKRPKQGGEKTTVLLGYRLISEFDPPLLA